MEEGNPGLIAEQFRHMVDLIRADLAGMQKELEHLKEMDERRLEALEKCKDDHEERIRSLQDGVTTFKVWSGLANGGSTILAIIAFVKAFIGIRP